MARLTSFVLGLAAASFVCPSGAHAQTDPPVLAPIAPGPSASEAVPTLPAPLASAVETSEMPAPTPPEATKIRPRLRVDPIGATIVAGWGWAFWITTEAMRPTLASKHCRWCDRDAAGNDTLNAFDKNIRNSLRWYDTDGAAFASDITAFVVTPLLSAGTLAFLEAKQDGFNHAFEDAVVIAEAGAMAAVTGQIFKYSTARARPYAHARAGGEYVHGYGTTPVPDDNLSFYSGHATFVFCLATASGTVASMRGFKGAGWVWAGGLAAASLASYLRVAADRHYASDVLMGAAVGSAMGFAFPYLLHRPLAGTGTRAFAAPAPGGGSVYLSGTF